MLVRGEIGEVMGESLVLVPLTYYWCHALGPRVSEGDRVDCIAHKEDTTAALLTGLQAGPSAAILDKTTGVIVGACGWTYEGNVWSLWADLTWEQSREIMRHTKEALVFIAKRALAHGVILSNVVWEGNARTLAWLRASKCFDFSEDRLVWEGKRFIPFFVKPMEELLNV